MPTYLIETDETVVYTRRYRIEAANLDEAQAKFNDGLAEMEETDDGDVTGVCIMNAWEDTQGSVLEKQVSKALKEMGDDSE